MTISSPATGARFRSQLAAVTQAVLLDPVQLIVAALGFAGKQKTHAQKTMAPDATIVFCVCVYPQGSEEMIFLVIFCFLPPFVFANFPRADYTKFAYVKN